MAEERDDFLLIWLLSVSLLMSFNQIGIRDYKYVEFFLWFEIISAVHKTQKKKKLYYSFNVIR